MKDLVRRTETNKLVTDLVNLDRVRSLLKTITYRRRFLAHKRQLQAERYSQQGTFICPRSPRSADHRQTFHPSLSTLCPPHRQVPRAISRPLCKIRQAARAPAKDGSTACRTRALVRGRSMAGGAYPTGRARSAQRLTCLWRWGAGQVCSAVAADHGGPAIQASCRVTWAT